MTMPPISFGDPPTVAEVMEEMQRRAQVQWPKPIWQLPACGPLDVEAWVGLSPEQMRSIRDQALGHAAYIGPALGEDFDLEDAERLERVILAAKRFEKYLIEGE